VPRGSFLSLLLEDLIGSVCPEGLCRLCTAQLQKQQLHRWDVNSIPRVCIMVVLNITGTGHEE
jgi:hypothetical protein